MDSSGRSGRRRRGGGGDGTGGRETGGGETGGEGGARAGMFNSEDNRRIRWESNLIGRMS